MRLRVFPEKSEFMNRVGLGNVIPVSMDILADTETPLSALAKIYSGKGPVFLLESVEGGERWGRYSFLGASAQCSVRVYREKVELEENGSLRVIPHHGDPLPVLRSLMAGYRPVSFPGLPRFWGGMVGYLAYEFVSFFENIPNAYPEDRPLAHFVIPDRLFIFDNIRHTLTLVAYTFLDGKKPSEAYEEALVSLADMQDLLTQPLVEPRMLTQGPYRLGPRVDPDAFRSQVARIKEYITAGDIIQAVLSQPFGCSPPPDPWWLYRVQRYINPSPYLYFMHLDHTVLVGSSPETMVRLDSGIATLRPIAGTRPRGKTEQEDRQYADELLQDPKERAEHLMLVDLGRNDLGRIAETGTVQVTDLMVVERYSHVMHLVSNISCDLRSGLDAFDLLRATFPAGTLSGAPKIRAMEIIAELEEEPRGPYGGAIGYISFTGNMDLAITIRTATIQNGTLTVRAGAGIVADSDPERERQETVNKAMAMQRALELVHRVSGS
ncbi:MAG TPA: anthranilate synthase component I family protein [Syntrophobacteraceae bacterium]|nr:anthranilate synthase component I family protein [Syntrophobacteraceae bacterium]